MTDNYFVNSRLSIRENGTQPNFVLIGSMITELVLLLLMMMMANLTLAESIRSYCRKINLPLQHLNAGQSLTLMHSDLANKPLLEM